MTHKTTMPEPVAKVHVGNPVRYEHIDAWCLDVGTHYLITTTQAEAYANARVREALEEAAMILKANAEVCHSDTAIILRANAEAIRALIPKEPPCET